MIGHHDRMNRIDIRLPGQGEPALLASFDPEPQPNDCEQSRADRIQSEPAPIRQSLLGAPSAEYWLAPGPVHRQTKGRFWINQAPDYQFLVVELTGALENMRSATEAAYTELLALITDSGYPQLLRFWNYIPNINQGHGDEEIYRQFCWGRADAFESSDRPLPAATGIGSADKTLRISALTATSAVQVHHLENPRQLSAYHYPRQYGPRSPSFARATQLTLGGETLLLLSGTSSIVHHETRHPNNLCAQTNETQRNIAELLATSDYSGALLPKQLRYYLRRPEDLCAAQSAYQSAFPGYPPAVFMQGDICRSELVMEIDGVFGTY